MAEVEESLRFLAPQRQPLPQEVIMEFLEDLHQRICPRRPYPENQKEMDAICLLDLPARLFGAAHRRTWTNHGGGWMPLPSFIRKQVQADLDEMNREYNALVAVRLKLETLEMKARWDRDARERSARRWAAERARYSED